MHYELWDSASGNMVETYASEEEAISVLIEALAEHGTEYVATLMLGTGDESGGGRAIAEGPALVDLVRSRAQPTLRIG